MTYQEKLDWLRKAFSNDPKIRAGTLSAEIPRPLFDSSEEFAKALKELDNRNETGGVSEDSS